MENIFKFATKELSQDAFLCWFIANCNDEKISKYSYDFINLITGFNFKVGDIKEIKVRQQLNNMDVVINFWTSENKDPESHYVLVIEDKVNSLAGKDQLKNYAKVIDKRNNGEQGYKERRRKIFYKVNKLKEEDKKELEKGNEGYDENDRWRCFDIEKIYKFFEEIKNTKSEVLDYYAEHIRKIYNDINEISNEKIEEWNYLNFLTYFEKAIETKFKEKGWNYHAEDGGYQGRLVSYSFYYKGDSNSRLNKNVTKDYPCFAYPLVEFIFKKRWPYEFLVYTHITYHRFEEDGTEKREWKYQHYKPSLKDAEEFKELVKNNLKNIEGLDVKKVDKEKDQTISSDRILFENKTRDEIENEILNKINECFEAFKRADEAFNE